jgi:hypothetical protein
MATTTDAPAPLPQRCPLARDADGNAVEIPPEAACWRVRRHTGGRPRLVLDVNKQPMQLPLGYTLADLEDILSPGAYRLDLVDPRGETLHLTVPVAIGMRNVDVAEETDAVAREPMIGMQPALLPSVGSDTRLVLEANVRATQLAFQHNQRTLELNAQMTQTLREGIQALADAQAEWIKSAAGSRGFYRNMRAAPPHEIEVAAEPHEPTGESDEPEGPPDWVSQLMPVVGVVVQQGISALMSWSTQRKAPQPSAQTSESRSWLRDAFDWRGAHARGKAGPEQALPPQPAPPFDPAHFMAIQAALTPAERALAQEGAAQLSPEDRETWMNQLGGMTVEEAVAFIRRALASVGNANA